MRAPHRRSACTRSAHPESAPPTNNRIVLRRPRSNRDRCAAEARRKLFMSTINHDPRAPRSGAQSNGVNHTSSKPQTQEEYQTAKGCLLLAGVAIASLALIFVAALTLGNFD